MNHADIVEDVSDRVRSIELVWIPMADGRRLPARICLPLDAESRNTGSFSTPCRLDLQPAVPPAGAFPQEPDRRAWHAAMGIEHRITRDQI